LNCIQNNTTAIYPYWIRLTEFVWIMHLSNCLLGHMIVAFWMSQNLLFLLLFILYRWSYIYGELFYSTRKRMISLLLLLVISYWTEVKVFVLWPFFSLFDYSRSLQLCWTSSKRKKSKQIIQFNLQEMKKSGSKENECIPFYVKLDKRVWGL